MWHKDEIYSSLVKNCKWPWILMSNLILKKTDKGFDAAEIYSSFVKNCKCLWISMPNLIFKKPDKGFDAANFFKQNKR